MKASHAKTSLTVRNDTMHPFDIDDHEVRLLRSKLDYSYHGQYTPQREDLQLNILKYLYKTNGELAENPSDQRGAHETLAKPIVICLAGPMAAGKSYLVQWMRQRKYLPFKSDSDNNNDFVLVNMDIIRELLPESPVYKKECPERYGELTQRESGTIAELLIHLSLRRGRNIIIDSSMLQLDWQEKYLNQLRIEYVNVKMLLVHVTADPETIRTRALRRFSCSGRFVPHHLIEASIDQV
jgi:hypothetical protein